MPVDNHLLELLACPRCDKALDINDAQYHCAACKIDFPVVGTIPWLFADPDSSLGEWRSRLHFSLQQLGHESQQLRSELDAIGLHDLTWRRLENQLSATDKHREQLRTILAPVGTQSMQASYESYLALRTRLPSDQGLSTYYSNVHRDWSWGEAENQAALEQLSSVLGGDPDLGDTLVAGAGACRLPYDLHMQLGPRRTVAIDFNPLLLLIAGNVMNGKPMDLYEFPTAPKSLDDFAVLRHLEAPERVRDGMFLVLADVLRPPFPDASFDTVVTPWLIDIISEDLPIFAARINRLLKPGGRWINFGSLVFDRPARKQRYSPDEVLAIVQDSGFDPAVVREATIPYMCSPASRHGRQETVFTFCAQKSTDAERPARHKSLPDWIVTGEESVPLSQSFRSQAVSTQIYSFVMSLIDGKRSIRDMATVFEQQKLMTKAEAEPAIRNFLIRMYDDSQKNSGF